MANSITAIIPSSKIDEAQLLMWKYKDLSGTREWHRFNRSLTAEMNAGIERVLARYHSSACEIMGESWVGSALGGRV